MDTMIETIRANPTAAGIDRLLLPGEMEHGRRQTALQAGVELPADVVEKLEGLSRENNQPIQWMD